MAYVASDQLTAEQFGVGCRVNGMHWNLFVEDQYPKYWRWIVEVRIGLSLWKENVQKKIYNHG